MATRYLQEFASASEVKTLLRHTGIGMVGDVLYLNSNGTPMPVALNVATSPIYVDALGSDTYLGYPQSPVASLTRAMALVTATRKLIIMAPGTYAEAAPITWPAIDNVKVIGAGYDHTVISATGTSVISVAPGAVSSTFDGHLEGVEIDHSAGAAQSGIVFDNTSMGKKLIFKIKECIFSPNVVTDKSINIATHADSDNAIRVYVIGDGSQAEIGGATYFAVANNADRLQFENCWIIGSITLVGADQIRLRLLRCILPEHSVRVAVIGNNGLQTATLVDCFQWTNFADTVAELYEKVEAANVTTATAVLVNSVA